MKDDTTMSGLPREGETFDGKYRIGAVLGIGGMSAVLAARHLGFDEMVAIKVLLPECCGDPAVVERFAQEGKTAIKIRSEHVVRMLDVGVVDGRAYLVMEHLVGKDLDALLRDGGALAVPDAVDLFLQACEAIGEAHALGIIHRDLKPANLFLTHRVDGSPCVKVLDFGISKMPRSVSGLNPGMAPPTLPAVVMGSPQYMSPEQMASAATADQRSDIWSLGAILYELLSGRTAFSGATTAEVCARVLQGVPAPLESVLPGVPSDLALIVSRCLEKDRMRRYANVAELARALAHFGTAGARASAASISLVFEGGGEARSAPGDPGTMKPTAAEMLALPPRGPRRFGYAMGGALPLLALGVSAGVVGMREQTDRAARTGLAAAPSLVETTTAAPPVAARAATVSAAPPVSAPVAPSPPRHSHASAHARPAPELDAATAPGDDEAGPYDAIKPRPRAAD